GWAIDTCLEAGDKVFGDRSAEKCAVSQIPGCIQNAEIILTPCDAKASGSAQADLTAVKDITLFAGVDSRVTSAPSWLDNWTKPGISLVTSNDVIFELYALELKAGETVTLGANGQATGCMNYIILASDNVTSEVRGDLNMDGKFDITDVALLQKWLLAVPDTELANWKAGDLYEDGVLNVFDLCMMKRELLDKSL
ncbi:MAG: dockerin type I repeat-containing protein, partial [Porcipelethomonas sp.]